MEPNDIDHIYRDGRHYDQLFGAPDVTFWVEQAHAVGGTVLEMGCGTGKISIPLAEAGLDVVGLDMSEAMLAEARRKTDGSSLTVEWTQGDMREFELNREFGLIILPSNNLCHLLTIEDVARCLGCVRRHLRTGGRFIISVFVPNMRVLLRDPTEEALMFEYQDPDGRGEVVVTDTATYEPHTQIRRIITCQKIPGESPVYGHLNMRMFFPQELDALVRCNGFRMIDKYAGLDRKPFDAEAKHQVIVAETADSTIG
jgi:2-polyprenyl-3-methyl-5-hydroxy-6-metoxy-1,4-benzoquinol methylase